MAGSFPDQMDQGIYVPQSLVWDVEDIYNLDVKSEEFKELLVRLYQNVTQMAIVINYKSTGLYILEEYLNSSEFFADPATLSATSTLTPENRSVFRKVINFGALPNAGAKNAAHDIDITSGYTFTHIYGTANDTAGNSYIPLPYSSPTLNENISLEVDATNVTITTGSNRTNYTTSYVILEYIKE